MKYLNQLAIVLSVFAPTVFATTPDTVFNTNSGKWIIQKPSDDSFVRGVYYNGKLISEYDVVSIDTVISFSNHEVLILGIGSPNGNYSALNIVYVNSNGAKIISDDIDVTGQETSINVKDGIIIMHLGYKDGKTRVAKIDNDNVNIEYLKQNGTGSMSDEKCKSSYNELYGLCNSSSANVSGCTGNSPQGFNSAYYQLLDEPYFNKDGFIKTCQTFCKKNKEPTYKAFAAAVCKLVNNSTQLSQNETSRKSTDNKIVLKIIPNLQKANENEINLATSLVESGRQCQVLLDNYTKSPDYYTNHDPYAPSVLPMLRMCSRYKYFLGEFVRGVSMKYSNPNISYIFEDPWAIQLARYFDYYRAHIQSPKIMSVPIF